MSYGLLIFGDQKGEDVMKSLFEDSVLLHQSGRDSIRFEVFDGDLHLLKPASEMEFYELSFLCQKILGDSMKIFKDTDYEEEIFIEYLYASGYPILKMEISYRLRGVAPKKESSDDKS